jgi:hypothetical protein
MVLVYLHGTGNWKEYHYIKSFLIRRMPSSGMLLRVTLVRTDASEERIASIRVTRIGELGTTLAVTSNQKHTYC